MSAFIVDDSAINRVVSHIYMHAGRNSMLGVSYMRALENYPLHLNEGLNKLADDMFKLNVLAVDIRYPSDPDVKSEIDEFQYKFTPDTGSLHQVLASLRCWLYQCSEGDIPETSELYEAMTKIKHSLAYEIIDASPEWKATTWG